MNPLQLLLHYINPIPVCVTVICGRKEGMDLFIYMVDYLCFLVGLHYRFIDGWIYFKKEY